MRLSSSRGIAWPAAVFIVMLEAAFPQRAFAQRRAEVLPGLRFGPPIKAGFALGVAYGDRWGVTQFAGPLVLGEVGLGGARVSAGYFFAFPFASGLEILGSAIRTWRSPSQMDPGVTMLGGEVRASGFLVNVGLGVFRPTAAYEGDRRTRYYLNLGLGI